MPRRRKPFAFPEEESEHVLSRRSQAPSLKKEPRVCLEGGSPPPSLKEEAGVCFKGSNPAPSLKEEAGVRKRECALQEKAMRLP